MKRTRLFPIVIILLLAGAGMWFITKWANSPVKTTTNITTQSTTKPPAVARDQLIETEYFHAKLPSGYGLQIQKSSSNPTSLIQLTARTGSQQNTKDVAITVGKLPAAGIEGIGDYTYRKQTTNTYEQTTTAGLPTPSIAFRKIDGSLERTVFLQHNGYYAIIAYTAGTGKETAVMADMRQLLANWQWMI